MLSRDVCLKEIHYTLVDQSYATWAGGHLREWIWLESSILYKILWRLPVLHQTESSSRVLKIWAPMFFTHPKTDRDFGGEIFSTKFPRV